MKFTKGQELTRYLESASHWGGWTLDYLGIACTNKRAASRVFDVLRRDARNTAIDVIVARGVLKDDSGKNLFTAGLICMNKDARRFMDWIGTIEDIDDADIQGPRPFHRLDDKNLDYFGQDNCLLSIGDFAVVGGTA